MRGAWKTAFLAAWASAAGCSLALDFDALESGGGADTETEITDCAAAADCDDGVDCTIDNCRPDGTCQNTPDNSSCDDLEVCDIEEGCVPTGDECDEDADCDDGVVCTIDTCYLGTCLVHFDDDFCESDDPCIENEACDPAACLDEEGCDPAVGCLPGNEKYCEQSGAPCHVTACDSSTQDAECVDFLVDGADDDGDTFLDAECGGDDCDDGDESVHPGAEENCNGVDDDCDELVDATAFAGPVEIAAEDDISSPSVGFGGGASLIVWQSGADAAATVHAAALDAEGNAVGAAVDFTAEGGPDAAGLAPDVAYGEDGFWVAWVAYGASAAPRIAVIDFAVDEAGGALEPGTAVAAGSETASAISLPRIAHDGAGSGWVVVYAASYGGSVDVELAAQRMHAETAGAFSLSSAVGAVDGLSIAVLDADSYAVSYSRPDDGSDGDSEVFATEVGLASELWSHGAGFPLRISAADAGALEPSFSPSIASDGAGGWAVAFADTDPLDASSATDIVAYAGGALVSIVDAGSRYYREPSLAHDGTGFGILSLERLGTYESLQFRTLDAALAAPAAPYDGTELAVSTGANDTNEGRLVAVGPGRFAAIWISRVGDQDHLRYLDFAACGSGE